MCAKPVASLESACRDGEDELYYNMLLEEDPWNKLQVQAVLSAVCLTASTVICWLCEKDPAGEREQLRAMQCMHVVTAAAGLI